MQTTLPIGLVFLASLASSCFITNCPAGGKKRSSWPWSSWHSTENESHKQCSPCGPRGLGRCFSPSLCCGPLIGCFHGTAESEVCGAEDYSLTPCRNHAQTCRAVDRGQCVMKGYCCNDQGHCNADPDCPGPGRQLLRQRNMELLLGQRLNQIFSHRGHADINNNNGNDNSAVDVDNDNNDDDEDSHFSSSDVAHSSIRHHPAEDGGEFLPRGRDGFTEEADDDDDPFGLAHTRRQRERRMRKRAGLRTFGHGSRAR